MLAFDMTPTMATAYEEKRGREETTVVNFEKELPRFEETLFIGFRQHDVKRPQPALSAPPSLAVPPSPEPSGCPLESAPESPPPSFPPSSPQLIGGPASIMG
jgi:hypothetical protein